MSRRTGADAGAAVVDFVLMSVLLVMLLFAVLQVAVYFYARNVAASSAADAARYASAYGVSAHAGAGRAELLIREGLGRGYAGSITCVSGAGTDPVSGLPITTVECRGDLPLLFTPLHDPLPLDVRSSVLTETAP